MVKSSSAQLLASHPLPVSIPYANPANPNTKYLSSSAYITPVFGHLSFRTSRSDANSFTSSLAIAQAVQAIEDCHNKVIPRQGVPVPQTVRVSAERTIRHARRVMLAASNSQHLRFIKKTRHPSLSLEHNVRLLRREVVRAIRHEQLELLWPNGEISRPDSETLSGRKDEVASFVNRVFYAVTKRLGCFGLSLLPLNIKREASDQKPFWDTDGLGISKGGSGDYILEPGRSVASSEVSTEVEDELRAEWDGHEKASVLEQCEAKEDDENDAKAMMYEHASNDDVMDEEIN